MTRPKLEPGMSLKRLFSKRNKSLWKLIDAQEWEDVRTRLETEKGHGEANQLDFSGMTPLMSAVMNQPPADVVQSLIAANREAIHRRDIQGVMPLHVACANGASREVVDLLVKTYPKAIHIQDSRGMYPLHIAVETACIEGDKKNSNGEMLNNLIDAVFVLSFEDPELIDTINKKRETPENIASSYTNPTAAKVLSIMEEISNAAPKDPETDVLLRIDEPSRGKIMHAFAA